MQDKVVGVVMQAGWPYLNNLYRVPVSLLFLLALFPLSSSTLSKTRWCTRTLRCRPLAQVFHVMHGNVAQLSQQTMVQPTPCGTRVQVRCHEDPPSRTHELEH